MYRQYEDPYKLQQMLDEALADWDESDEFDPDAYEWIEELRERINFAWQDDEYDSNNRDYADEMWMYENVWG